jgi:hypothetical protein
MAHLPGLIRSRPQRRQRHTQAAVIGSVGFCSPSSPAFRNPQRSHADKAIWHLWRKHERLEYVVERRRYDTGALACKVPRNLARPRDRISRTKLEASSLSSKSQWPAQACARAHLLHAGHDQFASSPQLIGFVASPSGFLRI